MVINKKTPQNSEVSEKDVVVQIPHGREAVKNAILDATEKLLLERNPNQFTVREIAKNANVKHPLIYRHFGTKNQLIFEVNARSLKNINQTVRNIENLEGNIGAFFQAVEKNKFRQLTLARAMIDGVDPHLLQNQFSVMHVFLELVKKRQNESASEPRFDARILATTLTATALGWMLYEPFLIAAAGLEDVNRDAVKKEVTEILEELFKTLC